MKTQKHTLGPWEISEYCDDGTIAIGQIGQWTAKSLNMPSLDYETIKANAALIAAAPEMLEALERVFRELPANLDGPMLEQVESAIRKAKGCLI